ncbi:MAG: hypothetical protein IPL39_18010 [Opitutaceae bacterium]|nr:hypothetical protein [Opitutaceae bacterium]
MTDAELITSLRQFNRWRRGDEAEPMPDPRRVGELIDRAADRLEAKQPAKKARRKK